MKTLGGDGGVPDNVACSLSLVLCAFHPGMVLHDQMNTLFLPWRLIGGGEGGNISLI